MVVQQFQHGTKLKEDRAFWIYTKHSHVTLNYKEHEFLKMLSPLKIILIVIFRGTIKILLHIIN